MSNQIPPARYVGTLVGESTSREFRLALDHESVREQDIIAVDATLRASSEGRETAADQAEQLRVWAKVTSIERINPLFPIEAGHELAVTRTDPFDTVLSLSREMVTAVCQVLGSEPISGNASGKLGHLRYPPKPATSAYRPDSEDVARVVLGELNAKENRALDIATLSNRQEVDVLVDGHFVVTRHLAILAMTGAGKSWTARRIIEQLALKNYPIVIFDPHGDYTGLSQVRGLEAKVKRYYAQFPVFEEDGDRIAQIIDSLGYELTPTMRGLFDDLFQATRDFLATTDAERQERTEWLAQHCGNARLNDFGLQPNLYLLADLAEAGERILRDEDVAAKQEMQNFGWNGFTQFNRRHIGTLDGIKKRTRAAAKVLRRMEDTNRKIAQSGAEPMPTDRKALVQYGQISVVSLAGYTGDFQATMYSIVADDLFGARLREELRMPMLMLLEEAHNFAPASVNTAAERRAVEITRQIAQEGRKFGVGMILISQRPSRLDETSLSMCNSHVIMRMVNPNDQNYIRRVIESLGQDDVRMLPDLDTGEAILSGQMINFPVLARIKPPESQGEREEKDAFKELQDIQTQIQDEERRGRKN